MRSARLLDVLARVRCRVGSAAWRAALGPVAGSVPHRYVRSIAEQARKHPIATHLEDMTLLTPAHVEHYDLDLTLPPEFRRSKAFDDRYVYSLRDICVSARTGLCWLPEGLILEESYGHLIRLLGWGSYALREPLIGARRSLEGPVVMLPADGYFHWLLEVLPAALHALEQEPQATVLLPQTCPRYVDELIEILGLTNIYRSDEPVRVERLVLAARDPFSGFTMREDIDVLRRTVPPHLGRSNDEAIYVSRSLDPRRPANEADVERKLAKQGFRVVISQSRTLGDQIELFAGARVVAGPHGAGLANIAWSFELDWLGEISFAAHFNDCYARLGALCGARYQEFRCSGDPPPWGSAPADEIARAAHHALFPCSSPTGLDKSG